MLAMAEGLNQEIMWEGENLWPFQNFLGVEMEDGNRKLEMSISPAVQEVETAVQEVETAVQEVEKAGDQNEAPPRPATAGKGRKRAAAGKRGGRNGKGKGRDGGEEADHELHIWTERERRKKMRDMFANLQALLPHLPSRADKSTIVDEAVVHIKKLQETVQDLEKQKLERFNGIISNNSIISQQDLFPSRESFLAEQAGSIVTNPVAPGPAEMPVVFKTWSSANVVLNVLGREAHMSVVSTKKPQLLTGICLLMEKYQLDVISAEVHSEQNRCMYMIHAHANGGSNLFQQAFPVEEMYKQAAIEIMAWVNS